MADKKKVYGGKRSADLINKRSKGYYENAEAGNKRYFEGAQWGTKREFVGSKTKEYTFSDILHGTHTITAESYADALRIAESLGYHESDYMSSNKKR